MHLSVYLSSYLCIHFSIYLSTYLPIHLSIFRSIDLSNFLSIYISIYQSIYLSNLPICRSTDLSIYLSYLFLSYLIFLFSYLSISLSPSLSLSLSLSVCLSVYLPVYLHAWKPSYSARLQDFFIFQSWQHQKRSNSARLPEYLNLTTSKTKQFCETSSMFELDNVKNEAILRDFFIFQSWQHPKRSRCARLLHFLNWTTSKTKQVCETSAIFELDNIKNKAILRDFLQKWKVECRADSLVPMRFAIFPVHLSKVLRLPRKSDARSYEVLHLSRKIISANLKIWCSKMQPFSGNQRPHLLTAPMKMSLVLRLPLKMHLCRSSSNVPRLPSFLEMLQNHHVLLTFDKVHNPLRLPRETRSERPKVVRTCGVLYMLTSKCASRHNGVHFFYISTSKSGPNMWFFVHFDFEVCFAPQRRALFRHLNFQKWSGAGLFCTFWLANLLRATATCNCSSLIWPAGSAPAL